MYLSIFKMEENLNATTKSDTSDIRHRRDTSGIRQSRYTLSSLYGGGAREDSYIVDENTSLSLVDRSTNPPTAFEIRVEDYLNLPEIRKRELYECKPSMSTDSERYSELFHRLLEMVIEFGTPFEGGENSSSGIKFTFDREDANVGTLESLARTIGITTRLFDVSSDGVETTSIHIYTTEHNFISPDTVSRTDCTQGYPFKLDLVEEQ